METDADCLTAAAGARWIVDGESYFTNVAAALRGARSAVHIAGWWVCPEVFLERPVRADWDGVSGAPYWLAAAGVWRQNRRCHPLPALLAGGLSHGRAQDGWANNIPRV